MAVDFDFSDVDAAFDEFYEEAKEAMIEVGEDAVQYAKDNGDYQDHTGTLRKSNEYEVDETGLTLKNETEYASYVEAKGFEVLSDAALEAEKRLKEKFEIVTGDMETILVRDLKPFGIPTYKKDAIPEGEVTEERITVIPKEPKTGNLLD